MAAFAVLGATSATSVLAAPDGATTFKAKCAGCHGQDGSGNTPAGKGLKVKDLRSAEVQGQTDEQLFEVIAKGKGKMPGYEKTLGADACKELVAFVRKLKG
jgi:mono/diheme cytochrome c family protein